MSLWNKQFSTRKLLLFCALLVAVGIGGLVLPSSLSLLLFKVICWALIVVGGLPLASVLIQEGA